MTVASPPRLLNRFFGGVSDVRAHHPTTGYATRSLVIRVERDADQYVATLAELPLFGEGDSPPEAALDLIRSLHGLRAQLQSRSPQLSPHLEEQLVVLNRLVG